MNNGTGYKSRIDTSTNSNLEYDKVAPQGTEAEMDLLINVVEENWVASGNR